MGMFFHDEHEEYDDRSPISKFGAYDEHEEYDDRSPISKFGAYDEHEEDFDDSSIYQGQMRRPDYVEENERG